jgi:hypothetical protein
MVFKNSKLIFGGTWGTLGTLGTVGTFLFVIIRSPFFFEGHFGLNLIEKTQEQHFFESLISDFKQRRP